MYFCEGPLNLSSPSYFFIKDTLRQNAYPDNIQSRRTINARTKATTQITARKKQLYISIAFHVLNAVSELISK